MKRLFLSLFAVVCGLFLVSCSNDNTELPDYPSAIITGLNTDFTATLTDPMTLKFQFLAPGYIASLQCSIESSTLVPYLLDEKGLGDTFDLANPSNEEASFLSSLGIANGYSVYGQTSAVVDLSTAMPKLFDIADADVNHKFKITVTDLYGQQFYFEFTIKQTKKN